MSDCATKLKQLERVIRRYHYALDLNEDRYAAAKRSIDEIQQLLGHPWVPGTVLAQRRRRFTWEPGDLVILEEREDKRG